MRLEVPASTDISQAEWNSGRQFACFWVGAPLGAPDGQGGRVSGSVLVDDIRFYPKGAQVQTVHYDNKWLKPICTVDANNNPTNRVIYDTIGRVAQLKKATKANPQNGSMMSLKEYHLSGE